MRYFLDTEFYEEPNRPLDLISIGIVCEDGREYYAENYDYNFKLARHDEWLKENVYPHLFQGIVLRTVEQIRNELLDFMSIEQYGKPEIWGYYAEYDWVVFCQIFGRMIDLPKGFPMYCRDLKQFSDELGDVRIDKQGSSEHNALNDARWNVELYEACVRQDAELKVSK